MATADRLQLLLAQNSVTGIDFVDVAPDQRQLDVYFFQHDADPQADTIIGSVDPARVEIYAPQGADRLPRVPVEITEWRTIDQRTVLRLATSFAGDFSGYRLRIDMPGVDLYFNDVAFSFKANCESDLDCRPGPAACGAALPVDFPVDYLARDFSSYRHALLAFAGQRYPDWQDRLEADVGVMLVEVMSALGDELAYYQDRIFREGFLESATQRRSLVRHASLVDYAVHHGLAASGVLVVLAHEGDGLRVAAGTQVQARTDEGSPRVYEIGQGLREVVAGMSYGIHAAINVLEPHSWDEDDRCLPAGATRLFVRGHHAADLTFDHPRDNPTGKWVVLSLDESALTPCPRRHLVRLIRVNEQHDALLGQDITSLEWEPAQALPHEMEIDRLVVHGNVVPITAGRTCEHRFVVGLPVADTTVPEGERLQLTRAVERAGNNGNIQYLQTLPDSEALGLAYLPAEGLRADGDARGAIPEIHLEEVRHTGLSWQTLNRAWEWKRNLLGVNASQANDRHFTLDDGSWERVTAFWVNGQEQVHQDYARNDGQTLCFGNDEFGRVPAEGTLFRVRYRLGNGPGGNAAPDTIVMLTAPSAEIAAVFNPFALDNGQAPESDADVRRFAPAAFRAVTYRAVRPEDYAEAAQRLPWVQRAGVTERWTGSWLSLFATPDPFGTTVVSAAQFDQLHGQMDRFRQAGREVYTAAPRFADLDLRIRVCVQPTAFAGDVKRRLLARLVGGGAFFSADQFTFGAALERSCLEAAIQECPGVRAVLGMEVRRRGWFDWRPFNELAYAVGMDEVIRVENDPNHPGRGSLKLIMEGGA